MAYSQPDQFESLVKLIHRREALLQSDPSKLLRWLLPPVVVRVLLVTDGALDYSMANFGLRTFIESLLNQPYHYVRFKISLAHIDANAGEEMMDPDPRIDRRMSPFKFDNPADFTPDAFDQVWLFGFSSSYSRGDGYPTDRLSDTELAVLTEFMNKGGGLFATGDHGALGTCLCSAVPRARSMRLWHDTPGGDVSMTGDKRNDTNRLGHDAISSFNDQSDDVPQTIVPKLYSRRWGIFRSAFPHPLLCSPTGLIDVMPDHPHEGECREPADPNAMINLVTPPVPEYPTPSSGSSRPLPEVISTNSVPPGNNANGTKSSTIAHSFGGICAYDGHRANVGRVVTDSTWHHFININLVGDLNEPDGTPKRVGFMASDVGKAHLKKIQAYYRNLAIWLSRPGQIERMRKRILWGLVWNDRVMEAVVTRTNVPLEKLEARNYWDIGRHARDVLGIYAGQCQAWTLAIYVVREFLPLPWLDFFDPWTPNSQESVTPPKGDLPGQDLEVFIDIALGGAIAALRTHFHDNEPPKSQQVDKEIDAIVRHGVKLALSQGQKLIQDQYEFSSKLVQEMKI